MSKNLPLLWKTLDHIEAHPDEWFQRDWVLKTKCGTAFCFAGTAVMLAHSDAEVVWAEDEPKEWDTSCDVLIDGVKRDIGVLATEDLGLTLSEADNLFDPNTTLDEMRDFITRWEAEELADVRTLHR